MPGGVSEQPCHVRHALLQEKHLECGMPCDRLRFGKMLCAKWVVLIAQTKLLICVDWRCMWTCKGALRRLDQHGVTFCCASLVTLLSRQSYP